MVTTEFYWGLSKSINIKLLLFWIIAIYYTSILNHWVYVNTGPSLRTLGTYVNHSVLSLVLPSYFRGMCTSFLMKYIRRALLFLPVHEWQQIHPVWAWSQERRLNHITLEQSKTFQNDQAHSEKGITRQLHHCLNKTPLNLKGLKQQMIATLSQTHRCTKSPSFLMSHGLYKTYRYGTSLTTGGYWPNNITHGHYF